jgi:hypothetical protein
MVAGGHQEPTLGVRCVKQVDHSNNCHEGKAKNRGAEENHEPPLSLHLARLTARKPPAVALYAATIPTRWTQPHFRSQHILASRHGQDWVAKRPHAAIRHELPSCVGAEGRVRSWGRRKSLRCPSPQITRRGSAQLPARSFPNPERSRRYQPSACGPRNKGPFQHVLISLALD